MTSWKIVCMAVSQVDEIRKPRLQFSYPVEPVGYMQVPRALEVAASQQLWGKLEGLPSEQV